MSQEASPLPADTATCPTSSAGVLWCLTGLFFLRVLGQALVAYLGVEFLPPMEAWHSGLIAYPILLPIQISMLAVMVKICLDVSRDDGFFAVTRKHWGKVLKIASIIYFSSMVLRYILNMALHPEGRWFGGTILIFFHFVLAGFLFSWGALSYSACDICKGGWRMLDNC